MKKVFGILIASMIFFTSISSAMKFSDPVEIGRIASSHQTGGGFWIDAASNSGSFWNSTQNFDKGIARFDFDSESIFCHYNYSEGLNVKFGDDYIFNTVEVPIETYTVGATNSISFLENDEAIPIYVVYVARNNSHVTILGKLDGRWTKFIDSKEISQKFFGDNSDEYNLPNGIIYSEVSTNGDTIVIPYGRFPNFYDNQLEGEFRFKWNESAKWFSVEHIVY